MLIDLTGLIINKLEKNYVNVNSIDRERERERERSILCEIVCQVSAKMWPFRATIVSQFCLQAIKFLS